jgi:hypothetical protein
VTVLSSGALNGPGTWPTDCAIQIDTVSYAPAAVPNGIPGFMDFVDDPLGQRGKVLRSTVYTHVSGSTGPRCEINQVNEPINTASLSPVTRWYKWDMMIPSETFGLTSAQSYVVSQVHDTTDGGDGDAWPNMIMYVSGNELQLMLGRVNPPTRGDAASRVAASYPLVRNQWMTIQYGTNLAVDAAGSIDWIIDGKLIHRENGHGTAFDDVVGPWHKIGSYNIFKITRTDGLPIGRAYYTALSRNSPPYAPGALSIANLQITNR